MLPPLPLLCRAWTYTPGRIDYIRVYSHEKDANGCVSWAEAAVQGGVVGVPPAPPAGASCWQPGTELPACGTAAGWNMQPGMWQPLRLQQADQRGCTALQSRRDPVYADFGSGPKSGFDGPRQEGYWLALEPFETIKRISLRGNGFGGNAARLGAIRFETT